MAQLQAAVRSSVISRYAHGAAAGSSSVGGVLLVRSLSGPSCCRRGGVSLTRPLLTPTPRPIRSHPPPALDSCHGKAHPSTAALVYPGTSRTAPPSSSALAGDVVARARGDIAILGVTCQARRWSRFESFLVRQRQEIVPLLVKPPPLRSLELEFCPPESTRPVVVERHLPTLISVCHFTRPCDWRPARARRPLSIRLPGHASCSFTIDPSPAAAGDSDLQLLHLVPSWPARTRDAGQPTGDSATRPPETQHARASQ